MRTSTRLLVLVVGLLSGAVAGAQEVSDFDRFQLFNECRQMDLVVVDYDDDAGWAARGLTEARIRTLVESRLRAARLYDADAEPWLYVNAHVRSSGGFSLSVEYKKLVYDAVRGETNYATTWDVNGTGTHSGDAGFILQGLSEQIDEFILEYLRVNEAAC